MIDDNSNATNSLDDIFKPTETVSIMANEMNPQGQGKPTDKMRNDAETMKQDAKAKASHASEQTKQQAKDKLDQNRETISRELDKVAHATQAAASDLSDQNREGLSRYVSELADNMSSLSTSLRGKSVDELVHDVTGLARRNPTLFVAGSIAIGLGLARFAKASNKETQRSTETGFSDTDNLYPGYSDAEPESRGSNWQSYDASSSFNENTEYNASSVADYTDRDYPSSDKKTLTGDQLSPGDNGRTNTFGGKRYE